MDLRINDKRVLVLGGSAGIGKGIAEALAQEGAKVCIASRSIERLTNTKEQIGAHSVVSIDLCAKDSGKEVVDHAISELGGVDILVINTGGPTKGYFAEIADEDWERQFQNLMLSSIQSIRSVLPGMQERQWGRVLLVTSIAAKEPITKLTVSNVLRSGLLGLVNTVSKEIAKDNVTINSILPGYTKTERLTELGVSLEAIADSIPAKRLGNPEELGQVAAFLCSEQAAYINGQAICYDGGLSAGI